MIYNVGIALPVLLLGGIIALGMSPEQVDHFRNKTPGRHSIDNGNYAYSSASAYLLAIDLS